LEQLTAERPELSEQLHPRLSSIKAEIIWAVRFELARTIEDVLARRLRVLLLDARAAIDIAPTVADLIAEELNYDENWKQKQIDDFVQIAGQYLLSENQ
jgi:glycerol-3-phosphate dehydrogenase